MSFQKRFKKGFDPSRKAGPDNPLPDAVYDKSGFKGYRPKSFGTPSKEVTSGVRGETLPGPPPSRTLGSRVWQDVTETVSDIKDEPGEVPFRIKSRFKDYFKSRKQ